jgi:hypothetical protein
LRVVNQHEFLIQAYQETGPTIQEHSFFGELRKAAFPNPAREQPCPKLHSTSALVLGHKAVWFQSSKHMSIPPVMRWNAANVRQNPGALPRGELHKWRTDIGNSALFVCDVHGTEDGLMSG